MELHPLTVGQGKQEIHLRRHPTGSQGQRLRAGHPVAHRCRTHPQSKPSKKPYNSPESIRRHQCFQAIHPGLRTAVSHERYTCITVAASQKQRTEQGRLHRKLHLHADQGTQDSSSVLFQQGQQSVGTGFHHPACHTRHSPGSKGRGKPPSQVSQDHTCRPSRHERPTLFHE